MPSTTGVARAAATSATLGALGLVLSLVLSVSACGSGSGGSGSAGAGSGATSTTPSTASAIPTATPSTLPSPDVETIIGVVSAGTEKGCRVLTVDVTGEVLPPIGGGLQPGMIVTVRGYRLKGVRTTCMQGKPFKITEVVTTST
ncbi:hypothetical protein MM440_00845 [Arsenicicoccus piscis]|uniref:hypothetical protein n=1 Tax=Arsenicicoccus piscis TaxID=673954 RepID=UPI001F4D23F4|nr:hypothetical protein [Arsenicicoccus piscis]MCH8626371.1 hypothetical protein [Arsenicicoccus piscis]